MKSALILVDIQNDFLPGGPLAVPDGGQIIPVVNRLMPRFDLVVATQDWHPADHGSFAVNHPGKRPFEQGTLAGLPQTFWPVHCVQHSRGAAFAPQLEAGHIAHVIRKGTDSLVDSYSGFFDNNHQRATGLGAYLREQHVTAVYIVGLATDYCVKATALDARQLGFSVTVIEDACRGVDLIPGDVARSLEDMRRAEVDIVRSDQQPRL